MEASLGSDASSFIALDELILAQDTCAAISKYSFYVFIYLAFTKTVYSAFSGTGKTMTVYCKGDKLLGWIILL
jgi:hypothetical protein